ncbi:hypothetical protein O181_039510 [Austropuccinia psidii MF-1]|uniref:Uncharacterized protein n=1 Tax=Austropuccinia psidii MF-1 TaxID=1389203 RepID=A0A9Q3HF87_9BASI|nr:hypothetical protein [Austropuccinia psidii MF-1]
MLFVGILCNLLLAGITIANIIITKDGNILNEKNQLIKRGGLDDNDEDEEINLIEICHKIETTITGFTTEIFKGCESGNAVLVASKIEGIITSLSPLGDECKKGFSLAPHELQLFATAFLAILHKFQAILFKVKKFPVIFKSSETILRACGIHFGVVLKFLASFKFDIPGWAAAGGIDVKLYKTIGVPFGTSY